MHIEHPITTQRALTEAACLESSTAAVRALSDAMAMICEQLLGGCPPAETHGAERVEQQQVQTLRERQD